MYERFYGFDQLPFSLQPDSDCIYLSERHSRVLERLAHAVETGSGLCVVTGESGVGKSTLIQALQHRLSEDIRVGVVDQALADLHGLAAGVVSALGCDTGAGDGADAGQRLAHCVDRLEAEGKRVLLIVDDAHTLPPDALKMLTELPQVDAGGVLQLFLIGQAELRRAIRQPGLAAFFTGCIALQTQLPPFSLIEADAYIRHRVDRAGGSAMLFTPSAIEAVYRYSRGVPRVINRVCDLVLVYGCAGKYKRIDETVVALVLKDRSGGDRAHPGSDRQKEPPSTHSSERLRESDGAVQVGVTAGPPRSASVPEATDRVLEPGSAEPPNMAVYSREGAVAEAITEQQVLSWLGLEGERDSKALQHENRDMAEFIRLSLQYHRKRTERYAFRIVAGVLTLTFAALWAVFELRPEVSQPLIAGNQPAATPGPFIDLATLEHQANKIVEPPLGRNVGGDNPAIPPQRQTNLFRPVEVRAVEPVPVRDEEPQEGIQEAIKAPAGTAGQAAGDPEIEATARVAPSEDSESTLKTLEAIRRLEAEQRYMERKLAKERAERARLNKETERERRRAIKAQIEIEESKEKARRAREFHQSAPGAYPEDADGAETPPAPEGKAQTPFSSNETRKDRPAQVRRTAEAGTSTDGDGLSGAPPPDTSPSSRREGPVPERGGTYRFTDSEKKTYFEFEY